MQSRKHDKVRQILASGGGELYVCRRCRWHSLWKVKCYGSSKQEMVFYKTVGSVSQTLEIWTGLTVSFFTSLPVHIAL